MWVSHDSSLVHEEVKLTTTKRGTRMRICKFVKSLMILCLHGARHIMSFKGRNQHMVVAITITEMLPRYHQFFVPFERVECKILRTNQDLPCAKK